MSGRWGLVVIGLGAVGAGWGGEVGERRRLRRSPVALPGVAHVGVCDLPAVGLLVQEVEHVLDGQGQGAATMGCAEDGLEQVVHKLL